jgi:hypothetical protein
VNPWDIVGWEIAILIALSAVVAIIAGLGGKK